VPRFFVPLFLALSPVLLVLGCSQAAGQQPVLTGATPGRVSGGAQSFLIIAGGNFARGARVQVGQAPVSGLTWVNASVLTALAPANLPPGSYDLSVTNPGGGSATLHGGVTVAGDPQPAVAPASTAAAAFGFASKPIASTNSCWVIVWPKSAVAAEVARQTLLGHERAPNRCLDAAGRLVAQHDGPPAGGACWPDAGEVPSE